MTSSRWLSTFASSVVLGSAASLLAPAAAHAGGLVLPGNDPISTGRGGAAVASVDDASAISINPAGLASITGTVISIGLTLVDYSLTVDRAGTYDDVPNRDDPWEGQPFEPVSDTSTPPIGLGSFQIVPVVSVAHGLKQVPGLTLALGVFAPTAYPTRAMADDYVLEEPGVAPPATRYDVMKQEAAVVLPSIAAAYRINDKIDVGARFSAAFANIKATTYVWGLQNYDEWAGKDAMFSVDTKDNFIPVFALGGKFRPTDNIELGASWSSAIKVRSQGTGLARQGSGNEILPGMPVQVVPIPDERARCATGGEVDALKACVDFDLPMQATLGGRWIVRDQYNRQTADVELDVAWENWAGASDYDIIIDAFAQAGGPGVGVDLNPTVIRHNFQDVFSVRLGGSWQRDVGPGRLTLRGGVAYDTAAAKTNWERADIDGAARTTLAAGASFALSRVKFDLGGGAVIEGTREQGTLCNPTSSSSDDANCEGGNAVTGPDPVQPTNDPTGQFQSPFAAGTYESGYVLIMLGASTWF